MYTFAGFCFSEFVAAARTAFEVAAPSGRSIEELEESFDRLAVELVLQAPYTLCDGAFLYPRPAKRVAMMTFGIIQSLSLPYQVQVHTALLLMVIAVEAETGHRLKVAPMELNRIFRRISADLMPEAEFVEWLERHLRP